MLSDLHIVDWSNHDRTNPSDQYLMLRSAPRAVQVCPAEALTPVFFNSMVQCAS